MSSQEMIPNLTIGLDLGDKVSRVCEIDAAGKVVRRGSVATTPGAIERYFGGRPPCRVVFEVGTHSQWVERLLKELKHETVVSQSSKVYGRERRRRNDSMDAEFLARQGRADPELLHPMEHRSVEAQEDLALLRARDQLVQARTKLINHVRGAVKPLGGRIGKCAAEAFHKRAPGELPEALRPVLTPLLEVIADLTKRIRAMDKEVERMVEAHPEAVRLQQPLVSVRLPPSRSCGRSKTRRGSSTAARWARTSDSYPSSTRAASLRRNCGSRKRAIHWSGATWWEVPGTSWARSAPSATCDATDRQSRHGEGRTRRSGQRWRWLGSSLCCCTTCG